LLGRGPHRLTLDHVHDRDQDDGSDQRDDEADDQALRLKESTI
jgi:hypothetical protein